MNKNDSRGVIVKILSRSPEVFIFNFKSREKYPFYIKVKKFRPKSMLPEVWAKLISPFADGNDVVVFGRLGSEKATNAKGEAVVTTAGADVYNPVIHAHTIHQISASIEEDLLDANTPAPAAHSAQAPSARKSAQAEGNPVFSTIGGSDDDAGLPPSPFSQ